MPKIKIVPFPGVLGPRGATGAQGIQGEVGLTGPIGSVASPYVPSEPSDWMEPQPTTIATALDQIASRLSAIE
jgi:hypothetical protein